MSIGSNYERMCVCERVRAHESISRNSDEGFRSLSGVRVIVGHLTRVLGTELGSSVRAAPIHSG